MNYTCVRVKFFFHRILYVIRFTVYVYRFLVVYRDLCHYKPSCPSRLWRRFIFLEPVTFCSHKIRFPWYPETFIPDPND